MSQYFRRRCPSAQRAVRGTRQLQQGGEVPPPPQPPMLQVRPFRCQAPRGAGREEEGSADGPYSLGASYSLGHPCPGARHLHQTPLARRCPACHGLGLAARCPGLQLACGGRARLRRAVPGQLPLWCGDIPNPVAGSGLGNHRGPSHCPSENELSRCPAPMAKPCRTRSSGEDGSPRAPR